MEVGWSVIIEVHSDHDTEEAGDFGHAVMIDRSWRVAGADQPIPVHDHAVRSW
jgi:hypothetical protein